MRTPTPGKRRSPGSGAPQSCRGPPPVPVPAWAKPPSGTVAGRARFSDAPHAGTRSNNGTSSRQGEVLAGLNSARRDSESLRAAVTAPAPSAPRALEAHYASSLISDGRAAA